MKGLLALLMIAGTAAAGWYLPAKARHHFSETGVIYTTNYLTLRVPGGVVGFPPGSRLYARFNIHIPDKEVVSNGKYTLAIDPLVLTHDVEYAQGLADSDQDDQDRTLAGIAQRKARSAANQQAAYLVASQDIDGINASLASSSAVGNYDTALHRPTAVVGAYGSYGGGGGYSTYNGGSTGTTINNVNVTQNNLNGGTVSRGGSGAGGAVNPAGITQVGKGGAPLSRSVSGLGTMPMNP